MTLPEDYVLMYTDLSINLELFGSGSDEDVGNKWHWRNSSKLNFRWYPKITNNQ